MTADNPASVTAEALLRHPMVAVEHSTHHDDCGCLSVRLHAEIDRLRTRVAELEAENAEMHRYWEGTAKGSYGDWRYHDPEECTDRWCVYGPPGHNTPGSQS